MNAKSHPIKSKQKQVPILARHAVSLSIAFVLALIFSYFVGQVIYRNVQLSKLTSPDQDTFNEGLAYIVSNAGSSGVVTSDALNTIRNLSDAERAADLFLAVAQSHADREDVEEPRIPQVVEAGIDPLMARLDPMQAIGLYDGLIEIKGIDAIHAAEALLKHLNPEDDAELLTVVDLLDTRLLWSKHWAPLELWVRYLVVLSDSKSELTQAQTAKRLGDLPEAVDDPRITAGLAKLADSKFETVRNIVLDEVAGYAMIAEDPTDYEQAIFTLGKDANKYIARRAWMTIGHLKPFSGFAVDWKSADPFVAEAMLWAAVKTNPDNDRPALIALQTEGYEAAGALAMNEWRRPPIPVSNADLIFKELIQSAKKDDMVVAWRSILASKDYMNAEAGVIEPYGYESVITEDFAPLYLAGNWVAARPVPDYSANQPFADALLTAYLEGIFERESDNPTDARRLLVAEENWPIFARLLAARYGIKNIDLDRLVGELPLSESVLLDMFTVALTHADNDTIDRFIRSSHPQMVAMAAMAAVIKGYTPRLIEGINAAFIRNNPDLDFEKLRLKTDDELASLGLSRIDALPALLDAAESAPESANREVDAKLLKLALWMRGDLGDAFTPTAEAMLFDESLPKSTILLALLHQQRPAALDYLFGDLAKQRPDLYELFIQQRYWHVFRQFVDTTDLTFWLWGDPEAQGFQLEAMRQWYAVNRWKIERGWWPEPTTTVLSSE